MNTFTSMLCAAIDYAGLFPPTALDFATCVSNYATYRASSYAWALGRIILPASMLSRLVEDSPAQVWPVSVLLGPEHAQDIELVRQQDHAFDTFECKVDDAGAIQRIMHLLAPGAQVFFELDACKVTSDLISAIGHEGAAAKIRTGGLTPDAIPSVATVARFMALCAEQRVPFKATAGLHHPVRGSYPLTYQPDAPTGVLHGFVNVMVAAAMLRLGAIDRDVCDVLAETDPNAFAFNDQELVWRGTRLSAEQIASMRNSGMLSFGSCSFTEPIADSKALGWLS